MGVGESDKSLVINNHIIHSSEEEGGSGISCGESVDNKIFWNNVSGFSRGSYFGWKSDSNAAYNKIMNCYNGFVIQNCNNISIYMNDIINCTIDIKTVYDPDSNMSICPKNDNMPNIFKKNNLGKGFKSVLFLFTSFVRNYWEGNYWGRARLFPKSIIGRFKIGENFEIPINLQFDWRPALRPYDIPQIVI